MLFSLFIGFLYLQLSRSVINLRNEFEAWVEKNSKIYLTNEEYNYRFSIFSSNFNYVYDSNSRNRSVTLALNKFADMTNNEFSKRHLKRNINYAKLNLRKYNSIYRVDIPNEVNWVQKGAVTAVKNQGECGSCWSFSATGAMEGAWFLHNGTLVSLSEQQLVDCSWPQGNQGCNGGLMNNAFNYVIQNGGICSEQDYKYGGSDSKCMASSCNPVAHFSSYVNVKPNSTHALMTAVASQPVSVAVEADGLDWQFYSSGIVTDSCGINLDHGVLIVGYGTKYTTQSQDYWLVKNSWGEDWGVNGYIYIGRGNQFGPAGECGIQMIPSYVVV
jgi:C1A family cysteine protease